MFCLKCGADIEEGTLFCTQCGAPVENQPSAGQAQRAQQATPAQYTSAISRHAFKRGSRCRCENKA